MSPFDREAGWQRVKVSARVRTCRGRHPRRNPAVEYPRLLNAGLETGLRLGGLTR